MEEREKSKDFGENKFFVLNAIYFSVIISKNHSLCSVSKFQILALQVTIVQLPLYNYSQLLIIIGLRQSKFMTDNISASRSSISLLLAGLIGRLHCFIYPHHLFTTAFRISCEPRNQSDTSPASYLSETRQKFQ